MASATSQATAVPPRRDAQGEDAAVTSSADAAVSGDALDGGALALDGGVVKVDSFDTATNFDAAFGSDDTEELGKDSTSTGDDEAATVDDTSPDAGSARDDTASNADAADDAFGSQSFARGTCPPTFLDELHYAESNEFWLGEQSETMLRVEGLGYLASEGVESIAATFRYSRTLALSVRPDGTLEDRAGAPALGYSPDALADDCLTTLIAPLALPHKATTALELSVNLDARASEPPSPFDISNAALSSIAPPLSVTFVDPDGKGHPLAIYFEYIIDGFFRYHVLVPSNHLVSGATGFYELGGGNLQFDAEGALLAEESSPMCVTFADASSGQCFSFDFGKSIADDGATGFEGSTSFEADTAVSRVTSDGYAAGIGTKLDVDASGVVKVLFDNEQSRVIGTLALARFPNEDQLERVEGSTYRQTARSGDPAFAVPKSPGRGAIVR